MVIISGVFPVVGDIHVSYSSRGGWSIQRAGLTEVRNLREQYIERTARETEEYLRN